MSQWMNNRPVYPNELYHYGVMGMKWGIRNYQPYPSDYKGNGVYKGKKGVEYGKKSDVRKYTKSLQREQKAKNIRAGQSSIIYRSAARKYDRAAKKDPNSEKAIRRKSKMEYWDRTSKDYLNAAQKHYKDVKKVYKDLKLQNAPIDRHQAASKYWGRSTLNRMKNNVIVNTGVAPFVGFGLGALGASAGAVKAASYGLGAVSLANFSQGKYNGHFGVQSMKNMQKKLDAKEYARKNYLNTKQSTGARHKGV